FVAVEAAFGTWDGAVINTDIYGTIHNGGTPPGVNNSVSWGPIDGPGGIIAQTSFSFWPNTKELVEFDIVFDADEDWSTDETEDTFDVQSVMTHELGHTLALDDLRSPRDGALTMHAYTWPEDTGKSTLGTGDVLGIQAIYGE
ncbi:MAG: matrixin family metalloprotease, partial [Planctomycetota bacterium]